MRLTARCGLVVLALCSLVACERRSSRDRSPEATEASRPYLLQSGDPMSLPKRPEKPLTYGDLLAIIYHYYPRWDPDTLTLDEYHAVEPYLPETRRRRFYLRAVWPERDQWYRLRDALRAALPGHKVDLDPLGDDETFTAIINLPGPIDWRHSSCLVLWVSKLAPVYAFYELRTDINRVLREGEEDDPDAGTIERLHEVRHPDLRPVVEAVRREIAQHYGYQELDPETALRVVPDISTPISIIGETTVADALFEPYRW